METNSKMATRVTTPLSKMPKKKDQPMDEKEKENEKARQHNKKMQDKDLPRYKQAETLVETPNDAYEIRTELGQGSFGAVYSVIRASDRHSFAMKCESVNMKRSILPHEAGVLMALNILKSAHFVELIDHGIVPNRFLFIVLKLVGSNLWDIRIKLHERRYTLNTALKISEQTLAGLRDLHRVGFLHRDIKPPNFAIGREEDDTLHTVYVLDFGLCRRIASKGKDLRTPRRECAFRGTTRYAALAAHDNLEQSRKDDIESWWYMTAEMIVAELPWKQYKGTDRESVRKAKWHLREDTSDFKHLFRKGCYDQMSTILLYLDTLEYTSIPDYDYVYANLQNAMAANSIGPKMAVDWDPKKEFKGPTYKTGESYIVKELE